MCFSWSCPSTSMTHSRRLSGSRRSASWRHARVPHWPRLACFLPCTTMPFNAIHRAHHGHGFAVALLALRETALVRFLLRRLAGCLPKTVFTHHDAFAVFAHDQQVSVSSGASIWHFS